MMNLSKQALALAVTAAVVGGGASLAQAQTVAAGGLGQALIYPYMTAKGGWSSFLHVINTSATTVAAKVRFRRATDSADAYDFIVVLSPYDVWTGVVEQKGSEYGFRPTDNSCTVPHFGKGTFTPFILQASEVYAEVIMMGVSVGLSSTSNPIAVAAKHNSVSGVPADCSKVEEAFANAASVANATEFSTALTGTGTDATNFLTGKFDLVNVGQGWSGASRATVIADFGAPPAPLVQGSGPYFPNTNIWSQAAPDFDHPTLAEGTTGLTALNTVLTKTNLINEWVLNPGLGELSSWIVTFPTKKLTVDAITAVNALSGQTPKLPTFGEATGVNAGCVVGTPSLWNREERQLTVASPGTTPLCYEVNVLNFKSGAIDSKSMLDSSVAPINSIPTDLISTGVIAGWMNLAMPTTSVLHPFTPVWTTLPGWAAAVTTAGTTGGRPVVGFNLTARATPSDTVLYDHAYLPNTPTTTTP